MSFIPRHAETTLPFHARRRPIGTPVVAAALAALALIAATPRPARADEVPPRLAGALRTVRAEGNTIMSWVYPTVTFRGVGDCAWAQRGDDAGVACWFRYSDLDGSRAARKLGFTVNDRGFISQIVDLGGDDITPAFTFLRLTKGLIRDMAKDELARQQPSASDADRQLLELLSRSPDPEEVLRFLLNVEILASS